MLNAAKIFISEHDSRNSGKGSFWSMADSIEIMIQNDNKELVKKGVLDVYNQELALLKRLGSSIEFPEGVFFKISNIYNKEIYDGHINGKGEVDVIHRTP